MLGYDPRQCGFRTRTQGPEGPRASSRGRGRTRSLLTGSGAGRRCIRASNDWLCSAGARSRKGMCSRNWRWLGEGPAYLKLGRVIAYRLDDVETFEAAHRRGSRAKV
jgi:hypothetical protein